MAGGLALGADHAALISSRLRAVWRLSGSAHASSARRSPSVCGATHRVSL